MTTGALGGYEAGSFASKELFLPEPKQSEVIHQIHAAWEQAQRQLADLRAQVEHTTELAQLKVQANFLERDLDRALRDFGQAVWAQVQKGKLVLPGTLTAAQRAMQEAQKKVDKQNADIADLLNEGQEAASRLKGKAKRR